MCWIIERIKTLEKTFVLKNIISLDCAVEPENMQMKTIQKKMRSMPLTRSSLVDCYALSLDPFNEKNKIIFYSLVTQNFFCVRRKQFSYQDVMLESVSF